MSLSSSSVVAYVGRTTLMCCDSATTESPYYSPISRKVQEDQDSVRVINRRRSLDVKGVASTVGECGASE